MKGGVEIGRLTLRFDHSHCPTSQLINAERRYEFPLILEWESNCCVSLITYQFTKTKKTLKLIKVFLILCLITLATTTTHAKSLTEIVCDGQESDETVLKRKDGAILNEEKTNHKSKKTFFFDSDNIRFPYPGTKFEKCESNNNLLKCFYTHGKPLQIQSLNVSITNAGYISIDRSLGTVAVWRVQFIYHASGNVHETVTRYAGDCEKVDRLKKKF